MMNTMSEGPHRSPFMGHPMPSHSQAQSTSMFQPSGLHTGPPSADQIESLPATAMMMGPPARTSPEHDANGVYEHIGGDQPSSGSLAGPPNAAAAAAAGVQQPKVVQTAFIHKLYKMLEDQSIQSLISWSPTAESFVMSPSGEFSKVLSQYFKHTNISSFVRQLNMYGFHKVSDVFHTGSPEQPMWEFKHGNGNFKRGDLVGLREIKRRASRHALVHRDSAGYSVPKPQTSQPGTPAEPMQALQDSTDSRLTNLEHNLYDMHARLARSEENSQFLHVRNQVVMDSLARSLQMNNEMSRAMLSLFPPETPYHRELINMQIEIQRQTDVIRSMDDSGEPPFSGSRPYFANLSLDNPPVSPRQLPQDDTRRPSMSAGPPRQSFQRPHVAPQLSVAPRRYGSIGGSTAQSSPSTLRPQNLQPPSQHPLASVSSPPTNLPRRHTSADIRNEPGWQANPTQFSSGQSSSHYPSSPKRGPVIMTEDQRIRDSFSSYSLSNTSQFRADLSRSTTPPFSNGAADNLHSWSFQNSGSKGGLGLFRDNSGPPTRRGSMAHILNPAETAERDEEHEEGLREDDRKRKRLQ